MSWKSAYNNRSTDLKRSDKLGIIVVAVVGDIGDWSAYALEVDRDGDHPSVEYVATNGDKISEQAARALFPICSDLNWRS